MLYAAKCYWPGVTASELEAAGTRARRAAVGRVRRGRVAFLGSMLFPDDELVLCLFDAPSQAAVKQASEQVGIPCERVMATVWLRDRRS
jgi:Nickel responsive protein SCO4226-like